jgi:uncharacterized Zn finger protein
MMQTVVGTPERRGANLWFVSSGRAGIGYFVERVQDCDGRWRWRCTCPSFRWKQHGVGTCKHIAAVMQARKGVLIGQR